MFPRTPGRKVSKTFSRLAGHQDGVVPDDLIAVIESTTDMDKLDRWFDVALLTDSLEAFRAAVNL